MIRRNTKSIELTDSGKKLYEQLKGSELSIRELVSATVNLKEDFSGALRIVLPPVFAQSYIIPRLMEFMALYPEIKLHLFFESKVNEFIKQGIDYAIMSYVPEYQNLRIKFLLESQFIMFCTPQYIANYGYPMTLDDIVKHKTVTAATVAHEFMAMQQIPVTNVKTGETTVVTLSDTLASNNSSILKDVVYSNEIICGGFLFQVREEIKSGKLIHVLPDYSFASVKYYQVRHPNEETAKVKVFANFIEDCIAVI